MFSTTVLTYAHSRNTGTSNIEDNTSSMVHAVTLLAPGGTFSRIDNSVLTQANAGWLRRVLTMTDFHW